MNTTIPTGTHHGYRHQETTIAGKIKTKSAILIIMSTHQISILLLFHQQSTHGVLGFTHAGGSLGTSGSVSFQFERKGQIMVAKEIETGDKKNPIGPNGAAADEDEFMMAVAEAGGDDYEDADEEWIVYTSPFDLMAVKKAIEEQGVQVKGAELTMIPSTPTEVSVADAKKVMRLIDRLEELEDLQNVYHTMDITDEIAEALEEE